MKVRDRMTPNPYTISPDSSVGDAWRNMIENKHTHLPVLDGQKVLGIITMKDFGTRPDLNFRGTSIATRYFPSEEEQLLNKVRVRDVMPVDEAMVTIDEGSYIEQAAKLLLNNNISGLPVVNDDGKLVGIITQTDILRAFLDMLDINRKGLRIDLRVKSNPETLNVIGQILSKYTVQIQNLVTMEIKDEDPLMILRLDTTDSRPIVNDFKAAGFKVESILVKQ